MSPRPRRALVGLLAAVVAFAALPDAAMASESISISPSSTQAGGNPTLNFTLGFAPNPGDTPETFVASLPPGLLANLNANASCLVSEQLTPACQIGTATVSTDAGPGPSGNLYLVPGQNGDAAGILLVATGLNQYMGVTLNPAEPGGLNLTTTLPDTEPAFQITGFSAVFDPTLNGQPFTRMPTSCGPATSNMTVTYYSGTPSGSASSSFTPTGCTSLPYAPTLSATITKDAHDSGGALALGITQAADESASKTITLTLPGGFKPNLAAVAPCLSSPCQIGTASATSPLIPSIALASGTVRLSASGTTPIISIVFPAPVAITLSGAINLTSDSVTFTDVPDLPLTSLNLDLTGPNGHKAFTTDCKPAAIAGAFTGQSGATHNVTAAVKFVGCAPTATGSTGGLSIGHPRLKFKVATAVKGGPDVDSIAFGLPGGLRFSRSAFVSHKTCTTLKDKRKKCTITTLISGLGISGGKAATVALKAGRLVVTLAKGAASVSVTISGPLVTETKSLQSKVKKHKVAKLTFTLKVTDATHTATTVAVKLRTH
ncbi:MAG TPA: hypothetical protein VMF57_12140 [Solirubrobacteraceae bacterium]|nr:hypothetical protein [Solirubrobacteraceae bacterium]